MRFTLGKKRFLKNFRADKIRKCTLQAFPSGLNFQFILTQNKVASSQPQIPQAAFPNLSSF